MRQRTLGHCLRRRAGRRQRPRGGHQQAQQAGVERRGAERGLGLQVVAQRQRGRRHRLRR